MTYVLAFVHENRFEVRIQASASGHRVKSGARTQQWVECNEHVAAGSDLLVQEFIHVQEIGVCYDTNKVEEGRMFHRCGKIEYGRLD